jgi:hypothetical protein
LYFADGLPYASYLGRPLAVIPIDAIESVRRVCVDVPERNENFNKLKNFQFEIFLKRGEGDLRWTSKIFGQEDGEEKSYTSPLKAK